MSLLADVPRSAETSCLQGSANDFAVAATPRVQKGRSGIRKEHPSWDREDEAVLKKVLSTE
jgi:hypothetical protein